MKRLLVSSLILALLVSALAVALFADSAAANPMLLPLTVKVESPQNKTYYQTPNPVIFTYYPKYSWGSVKSLPNYHYYILDGYGHEHERVAFSPSFNGSAYRTTLYGLSDGDHSLTIIVTAWEEGELLHYKGVSPTVTFTIDTTPPKVSVLTPKNQTYQSPDIPLNFTVDKPISWIGYSLDGATTVTVPANATLTGLSEGSHTLTVYAGNTGKSETITFTIESFPTSQLIAASTVASTAVVCFGLLSYLLKFRKRGKSP